MVSGSGPTRKNCDENHRLGIESHTWKRRPELSDVGVQTRRNVGVLNGTTYGVEQARISVGTSAAACLRDN